MIKLSELSKGKKILIICYLVTILLSLIYLINNVQDKEIKVTYKCCQFYDCQYYNVTYNNSNEIIDSDNFCNLKSMFNINISKNG